MSFLANRQAPDRALLCRRELQYEVLSLRRCLGQLRTALGVSRQPGNTPREGQGGQGEPGRYSVGSSDGGEAVSQPSLSSCSSPPSSPLGNDKAVTVVMVSASGDGGLAQALRRFARAAAMSAGKRAECDAVRADKGERGEMLGEKREASGTGPLRPAATTPVAVLVQRLRQQDADNDQLRGRVEALRRELRAMQTRKYPGVAHAATVVAQAQTVADDADADDDGIALSIANCRREVEKQKRRQAALREAMDLALARHRGRQAALDFCSSLST